MTDLERIDVVCKALAEAVAPLMGVKGICGVRFIGILGDGGKEVESGVFAEMSLTPFSFVMLVAPEALADLNRVAPETAGLPTRSFTIAKPRRN